MTDPDFFGAGFKIAPDAFAALFKVGAQGVVYGLSNLCVIHDCLIFPVACV